MKKGIIYKIKTDGTDFTKLHDFEQLTGAECWSRLDFKNVFYTEQLSKEELAAELF